MIGSFISKHGIKIAVILLIAGAVYNFFGRTPQKINGFMLIPYKSNSILYKGNIDKKAIDGIAVFLQKEQLFNNNGSVIFGIDAESRIKEGVIIFMIIVDPTKLNEATRKVIASIWVNLKTAFFGTYKISGCFTDMNLQPIECLNEEVLSQYTGGSNQNNSTKEQNTEVNQSSPTTSDDPKEKNWTVDEIIKSWDLGATRIANAQHYLEINNNSDWRIYYTEQYNQTAEELGRIIYKNKLVKEGFFDYFAFYSANENFFNNGQPTYHFAMPFNNKELNNGEAEKIAGNYYRVFKSDYLKDVRLVIAICDYEFNVIKIYGE